MKCEYCNNEHDGSYGSGRFCSEKCARGSSTVKDNSKETKLAICKICGSKITVNKRANNKVTCNKCNFKQERVCLGCGKKFIAHTQNNTCCSRECQKQYKENIFLKEVSRGYFPKWSVPKRAKKYLIERNGHKCTICGTAIWLNQPVPLVFDHINGNSDDHKVNNCRIICNNCDAQLPTFAGRNAWKNDKSRRAEYRNNLYHKRK